MLEVHSRGLVNSADGDARAYGLEGLKQVSDMTGESLRTLRSWHKHKPGLFKIVLAGCFENYKNELFNL